MDADAVLLTAQSGSAPPGWWVWPLRRERVQRSVTGWGIATVGGFVLLLPFAILVAPRSYGSGGFAIGTTSCLLVLLAVVAFGSLSILLQDLRRLRHAEQYLLVMTPDDFVMAEPGKVTHVPMESIASVTLRGVKLPEEREAERENQRSYRAPNFLTSGTLRREPARMPMLAFLDVRTDREVVVSTDDTFDTLTALAEVLRTYARGGERTRTG